MALRLNGSTSGYVGIDAPATAANNTLVLPNGNGSNGQALTTNGSGTLSWTSITSSQWTTSGSDINYTSGKVLVGTSTSDSARPTNLQIVSTTGLGASELLSRYTADDGGSVIFFHKSRGASIGTNTVVNNSDYIGTLQFAAADGTNYIKAAEISAVVDGTPGANDMPGRLVFSTTADGASSPTERVRITNGGFFKATNTGSYPDGTGDQYGHYFVHNRTSGPVLYVRADSSSYAEFSEGALRVLVNRNTTNGSFNIAEFRNGDASGRCFIKDSGNLQNTNNSYGSISDIKLKENITEAQSQWDDIKAIEVKSYNFISKPDERQIGVIAQQVEQVSPGLVEETRDFDEDGNDLGTVTKGVKYSVLYMKAVKALQEAMERIETLETANASLEARLTALEGGAS